MKRLSLPTQNLFFSLSLLGALLLAPLPTQAQDTQGEIEIEDTTIKRRGYSDIVNDTVAYFTEFSTQLKALGKSKVSPLKPLPQDGINYLAAAYLFCALKKGTCPTILDAIMEVDAYNSALNGKTSCPNMSGFWKAWVAADMEKRLGYELNIGLMQKVTTFKKQGRPKYIKCKETIADIIADAGGAQGFLNNRYNDPTSTNVRQGEILAAYLSELQRQQKNVFIETNTKSGRRKSGGGKRRTPPGKQRR